ncbi:hypothetical protein ACFSO9_06090 [Mesonia maritima]|uniref:hypothetical protein n=1 Tax=Mesonia maritima TaxID=1793873 RepID=UPI003626AF7C
MKKITTLLLLLTVFSLHAQVVINELDCDTQSIDDKEFVELKSNTPNYSLDNMVLVFFNGSSSGGNESYYKIDLDGYTTDINGILLIGSNGVSPSPQLVIPANVIQNGADAVAIYQGTPSDFPDGTLATTNNLIDALVYGTGDSDATTLMSLLGVSQQIDEDVNNNKDFESIQRANDGSYYVDTPTPRLLNDGSGIILNGLTTTTSSLEYTEGDVFTINFTTEQPVTNSDLVFNFTLSNGSFNTSDYSGNTTITIPVGSTSASTSITLTDDQDDEGDEELVIEIGTLPQEYVTLNNNILIRVLDDDFIVAPWGTPTNPTFGVVSSTQPSGYYNSLDEKSGQQLRQALQDIIADPSVVRVQTYADIVDILKEADQNPANSNQVWLVYTEEGKQN